MLRSRSFYIAAMLKKSLRHSGFWILNSEFSNLLFSFKHQNRALGNDEVLVSSIDHFGSGT